MTDTLRLEQSIPVIAEPDVLVAGGGAAGIAAACAAARSGASVMLIERWGFLGGTITAVTLGGFCGAWTVTPDALIPIVGGIYTEFTDRLKAIDGVTEPRRWSQAASLPYDPSSAKRVADEITELPRLQTLFHTWVSDVVVDSGVVDAVVIQNKGGRAAIRPGIVIDCTGDGDVAAWAGAPFELGDRGITQFGSSMFRMSGVDMERFNELSRDDISRILTEVSEKRTKLPRTMVAVYPHPLDGVVHLNATRLADPDGNPFNYTDPEQLSAAEREGRRQVYLYEDVFRKHMPGFENARVVDIGAQVGIRETRLIRGDHVLSTDEVMNCVKHDDAIACNAWPVEIHETGLKTVWRFLPAGDYCTVPYRCLLPTGLSNVLMAGRCISASHEAQASIRVTAPAFALGEAAGHAAVLALANGRDTRQVPYSSLRDRLTAAGAILSLS